MRIKGCDHGLHCDHQLPAPIQEPWSPCELWSPNTSTNSRAMIIAPAVITYNQATLRGVETDYNVPRQAKRQTHSS